MSELTLYGYRYSVYTRVVSIVLHLKSAVYEFHDLNPFEKDITDLHPFGKVPALDHRKNKIFKTNAITRYLDRAISGLALRPDEPYELALQDQIISIIDHYAYEPMVRSVFAHRVFRPLEGLGADEDIIKDGLDTSKQVLGVLMIDYFQQSDEGRVLLAEFPHLSEWWSSVSGLKMATATRPIFGITT
ncbi:MAG: glutathione S-transferase family protein [Paracoccaceae bacterium]